ncbi:MAG: tyrosine-type recombinase/integrase [Polyangiaceae bacterium]|nr:tyrosine-type recombinase/integrase [Polyangiaceae bacterium]
MPREASGHAFERHGKWYARTPIGGGKKHISPLPSCTSEAPAQRRAVWLAEIARSLRGTGEPTHLEILPKLLDRAGAASDTKSTDAVREMVRRLVNHESSIAQRVAGVGGDTFGDVAKAWTSGDLAKKYPDHIKAKRSANDDRSWLEHRVLPLVGGVRLRDFKLDHAETVMRALPDDFAPASRRHVAQLMNRIVKMAVYPLRMIETNPLPSGWMPKQRMGAGKKQEIPYTTEHDAFVSCAGVAFELRLFAGFVAREGMRHQEAEGLTWSDVDLDRGLVRLDQNKTDDPRAWALRPDVLSALSHWHGQRGKPAGDALVFARHDGTTLRLEAWRYREALKVAGIERTALHKGSDVTSPTAFHALRALFVTEALARGMSEAWVSDRTGHRSSQMIATYKRRARTYSEAKMPPLGPLDALLGWGSSERTPTPPERTPHASNGSERVTKTPQKKRFRAGRRRQLSLLIRRSRVRVPVDPPENERLATNSRDAETAAVSEPLPEREEVAGDAPLFERHVAPDDAVVAHAHAALFAHRDDHGAIGGEAQAGTAGFSELRPRVAAVVGRPNGGFATGQ